MLRPDPTRVLLRRRYSLLVLHAPRVLSVGIFSYFPHVFFLKLKSPIPCRLQMPQVLQTPRVTMTQCFIQGLTHYSESFLNLKTEIVQHTSSGRSIVIQWGNNMGIGIYVLFKIVLFFVDFFVWLWGWDQSCTEFFANCVSSCLGVCYVVRRCIVVKEIGIAQSRYSETWRAAASTAIAIGALQLGGWGKWQGCHSLCSLKIASNQVIRIFAIVLYDYVLLQDVFTLTNRLPSLSFFTSSILFFSFFPSPCNSKQLCGKKVSIENYWKYP